MSAILSSPTVESITTAAAAIVTLVAALYLRHYGQLGPAADWLEVLRRRLLPWVDDVLKEHGVYAEGQVQPEEFVARVRMSPEAFEHRLDTMNFVRNPAASLKTDPQGRTEEGSWALRDHPLGVAPRCWILFEAGEDRTDVYAHQEKSSQYPPAAADHYRGRGVDVKGGVEQMRMLLLDHEIPHTLMDPPSESAA